MADLPSIPNAIPQINAPRERALPNIRIEHPRVETPQVATPQLAVIRSPWLDIADTLNKAGAVLSEDVAVPAAQRAGVEAVTLDKDGQPVVQRQPLIVGDAAVAFERSARTTALARAEPKIEEDATKIRLAHPGDPESVRTAGKAYVDEMVKKQSDPLLKGALTIAGERAIGANVRTAINEANQFSIRDKLSTHTSRLEELNDKAAVLARQPGGTETPEYQQTIVDRGAIYRELVRDPRMGYTSARATKEIEQQGALEKGEAVISKVMEVYKTKGNAVEAKRFLVDAMWGPGAENLRLTPSQRDHIVARGIGALERQSAEDSVDLKEFRSSVTKYIDGVIAAPGTFNDIAHNGYSDRAAKLADPKTQMDLAALRISQPMLQSIRALPTEQQLAAVKQMEKGVIPDVAGTQGEMPLKAGGSIFDQNIAVERLFQNATRDLQKHLGTEVGKMQEKMVADLENGKAITPEEISTFVSAVHSTGRYDLVPKVEHALQSYGSARGIQNAGESSAAMAAQFRALSAGGVDPVKRALYTTTAAMLDKGAKAMADNPLVEGATRDWVKPPRPLSLDDPVAATMELRQRDDNLARIREREKDLPAGKSVILPGEKDGVTAVLTQGSVAQAGALIQAINTLSPETRAATLLDLKDGLVGMSKSYDPARMALGMQTLDREWQNNPIDFAKEKVGYGSDALKRMQVWQTWKDSSNAAEIVEKFKVADDPKFLAARKALNEKADEELKKLTSSEIANNVMRSAWMHIPFTSIEPGNGLQAGALKADFDAHYTALREYGIEPDAAKEQAAKRIKTSWGVSGANNGQLMQNPPENYYPMIGGSHDWMIKPLEADIGKVLGKPRTSMQLSEAGSHVVENWTYRIIADKQTQADIATGRPPSYVVYVKDRFTGAENIPMDKAGNPMRYAWDAKKPQAANRDFFRAVQLGREAEAAAIPDRPDLP